MCSGRLWSLDSISRHRLVSFLWLFLLASFPSSQNEREKERERKRERGRQERSLKKEGDEERKLGMTTETKKEIPFGEREWTSSL